VAWALFFVALAIRSLYLFDIRHNPFFHTPVIDAEFYRDLGLALARGEGTGRAPFMMPPLYPLLLSVLFRLAGPDLLLAHALQILLGAGTAALTALLGCRLGGVRVGALAGALVATSHALLFVEGDLLATPLALFLDLAFLLFCVRFLEERERKRDLLLAGLCAGLAALARPTLLVSFALLLLWLAWRRRRPGAAVGMLLVAWLVLLPVTWHNVRSCGRLVWISANGGINFFIGNNPDMRRTVALRPGPEWRRMNDLPLREAGLVHPVERDRWFYREGMRFWRESPGVALQHTLEKGVRLLHNHESMRDFDFYYFAQHYSRLLRLPGWNFALLLALAVVGIVWARSGRDTERVLRLFLLSYAAGIVLFFVSSRYRAPLLPALAVFASTGIVWLWKTARQRAWRSLLGAFTVACLTFILSSIDWFGASEIDEVQALYRVGSAHQNA
jgi:4-amino-4-deoxy-L-arabinose transferase-like glycosyltransferase